MADDGSASNPRDSVKSSGWNAFTWIFNVIASFIGEFLRRLFGSLLPKDLDRKTIDTSQEDEIERTSSMATSSSSGSRRYDVFPSFSGEDVRSSFLSHLLKELDRRLITTFIYHKIERSCPIGPELISAITESRIAIVVFSKKYASSTWCLNELVEIHKCYNKFDQMVIPIFYNVDPSDVRKQKGEFGEVFNKTCKGETKDQKQKWMQALADVANLAGEHLHIWPDEAAMIEKITNDVFNKLITASHDFDDFVGIRAHLEAMNPMLRLKSEKVRIVGIVGTSGIGKTTIARALFSQLSSRFHHHAFVTYKRTIQDDYGMKLSWEEQFLSEILCQKNIKIEKLGVVKERLKDKKVLIVLDDVYDLELLNTLVRQTEWFGPGSRIIVITQDRRLLKAHEINLIYEVAFPSEDLALQMFCRSAFGKNSPLDGFMELAVEVVKLAGNLPLGLSVLGSSLKGRGKDDWMEMLPRLRNNLGKKIEEVLRVGYDRLDRKDQELFLSLAFANVFNDKDVNYIRDLLGDSVETNIGLKILAEKSLIRVTPEKTVEMHNLLQKLGKEIVRAESKKPGKRRFLEDVNDIVNVLSNKTGTETVLGIHLNTTDLNQTLYIHKKAFKGMHNLQFLIISNDWRRKNEGSLHLLEGLDCLPCYLKLLEWYQYPSKCLPFTFKAEFLVKLKMCNSKVEKLWEGTQPIGSLKTMILGLSRYLKEIPDLSKAINLEELDLSKCESLVTLPSSIQNASKLRMLHMAYCTNLESLPTLLNCESLKNINLIGCFRLRHFPKIFLSCNFGNCLIEVEDCLWNKNLDGVDYLDSLMRCIPSKFRPEHIVNLTVKGCMLEKLWEGVQSLGSLEGMDLSECGNLKEFPDLSKATNLFYLKLNNCKSLVTVPSTIGSLNQLKELEMKECTGLKVLPTDVNLSSLKTLYLSGCMKLRSFPQISWSIEHLYLNDTAIEEVPCCIENFSKLITLSMRGCKRLENISLNIFRLRGLKRADFSECVEVVTALGDASAVEPTEDHLRFSSCRDIERSLSVSDPPPINGFMFNNCFNLDGDAQELILRSYSSPTILPGERVPKYFTHQSSRTSLTITLPQSSLSQEFLAFKACVVLEPFTNPNHYAPYLKVCWHFTGNSKSRYYNLDMIYNTDHLVFVTLIFQNIPPPSELDYNDVEFEFFDDDYEFSDDEYEPSLYVEFEFHVIFKHLNVFKFSPFQRIKGCGIRVLDVSPSPDGSDGSKKPML